MIAAGERGFIALAKEKPILWAFAALFALEAGMNMLYGYRRGGGGIGAIGYAAAFFAIAFVAAWLPTQIANIRGNDAMAWAKTIVFVSLTLLCFSLSQAAGWSVMGVTMADGQAKRDDAAMQRSLTRGELERAQRDLAAITETAPAESLKKLAGEAWDAAKREEERKGCKTLCEQRKKEAAGYEERLGQAVRRDELKAVVIANSGKLEKTAPVAAGSPDVAVLSRISGASEEDVRFWFTVVLVGIIGLFANLGFALAGVGRDPSGSAPGGAGAAEQDEDWVWRQPRLAAPSPSAAPGPHHPPAGYGTPPASHPGPVTASGSPINIHFGSGAPATSPNAAQPGPMSPGMPNPVEPHPLSPDGLRRQAVPALPAPVAPDRPVDRAPVNTVIDNLLSFRAACVRNEPGAIVPVAAMYARYVDWAGSRRLARAAFETMLPMATGIQIFDVGGIPHFQDVALRAERELNVA